MSKSEFKTYEIEIQNSVWGSRSISANEIQKFINEYAEEGWDFVSSIERVENGYTTQIILVFKKNATLNE